MKHPAHLRRQSIAGFSLIELMVAVAIGLVITLIIFNVLINSEARKRTTTSVNDINQSGAYAAYMLDRAIRSSGSGFTNQRAPTGLVGLEGCPLSMRRGALVVLPAPATFPAPFNTTTLQSPVIAPVIIDQGVNSDVITVMSGSGGMSEIGVQAGSPLAGGTVPTPNTLNFRANDIVLFAHAHDPAAPRPCTVTQVGTPTVDALPLAGAFVASSNPAADILAGDVALSLGNPVTSAPQFRMYGVGANQTLVSYDLLDLDSAAALAPIAENVIEMRAIYGVDTNDDNVLDGWVDPTGAWSATTLRDGSVTSSQNLRRIVAVRLVLALRSSLLERDPVPATTTFTLYADLPAGSPTRALTYTGGDAARYRYRIIESTIPVRNNLL